MDADTQTQSDELQLAITSDELDSIAETSEPFIGNWQQLISQTNWEKGKIIQEWRTRLLENDVAAKLYSDPAWSRLVGEVSPQHVGRLRRTWTRFGKDYQDYEGLYWSHFFVALEWEDSEMWLEGAVQNKWSVSKMRYQRWETLGKLKEDEPNPRELVANPDEEGVSMIASPANDGETVYKDDAPSIQGPLREGPDFGEDADEASGNGLPGQSHLDSNQDRVDIEAILADIPAEIARPFRQLRTAIAAARTDDWSSVKRIHLIALVNDLKMLLRKLPKPAAESETTD